MQNLIPLNLDLNTGAIVAKDISGGGGGTGSVTSVGLEDTSSTLLYLISNSPVTSSGNLTITLKYQSANRVFAGPPSGPAAEPSFRSLVDADIPTKISLSTVTAKGDLIAGTGPGTVDNLPAGADGQFLQTDSSQTTGLKWSNVVSSGTSGYLFTQNTAITIWNIVHNKNSTSLICQIYDTAGHMVLPNDILIVDTNTVQVTFASVQNGSAHLMFF